MSQFRNTTVAADESGFSKAMDKVKNAFIFMCRNYMSVSKDREFFKVPIIAFAAAVLLLSEIALPVILISLFCGVEYTIGGEDLTDEIIMSFRPKN